jgi:hypothetical protein
MDMDDFKYTILDLVDRHYEGSYWDFKKMWDDNKVSLLHDIICMANNLEDRDAYLIFGVDEENDFKIVDASLDKNRKNTNELITFLRDKKFQGGIRPTVSVKNIAISEKRSIDVVEIKNTRNTPYILTEDFIDDSTKKTKILRANSIYTRVGDTNTPIDKTADLDKIEYLWKKRFAIDQTAMQRLEKYLIDPNDWEYDDEESVFYNKIFPEFTVNISRTYYDECEYYRYRGHSEFYCKLFPDSNGYHWESIEAKYHQTIIYKWIAAYLDGGNHLIAIPKSVSITREDDYGIGNMFRLFYYDTSNIIGKLNRLFLSLYPGEHAYHKNGPLGNSVLVFNGEKEKNVFCEYIAKRKKEGDFSDIIFFDEFEKSIDASKDRIVQVEEWEEGIMNRLNAIFDEWKFENLYF